MSSSVETETARAEDGAKSAVVKGSSWALWTRQTIAVLRLEIEKNFWGKRAFLIYLLAALPVLLLALLAVFQPPAREWQNFNGLQIVYSVVFNSLILRTVVFFGCAWIFMNLFRGEVVDRSLHYYFLSPVRREVLVIGKYLSGLVTSIVLFTATTLLTFVLLYFPRGVAASMEFLTEGQGLSYLLTYAGITVLACVGYGAFFLVIGLLFRNPVVPALLIYGWEWINFLLPPLLKKVSVIHYLHSLDPVPLSEGPFAILAEPTPAWLSVLSLLGVTFVLLALASWRIRRMEIRYGGD